ncbi:Hypothetical predicted protein [Paramuricea clavata]|uniref:Nuclear receptor-binding factor 2 MIT domain-containing protein n=1 Tax=Paramuricea clavata TaxID=317549 RepID=A0A7D9IBA5_PARCT|nr:Hypothetical predicted protein [Paramuricea clavata]
MDSPLNRAHRQERKAEKLISGKKYMEALACYEISSGYMTEAMKTTTASQALISMQLQYEDYLRKQKLLRFMIERMAHTKMKTENFVETKVTLETNNKLDNSEVLCQESNDSSLDLSVQSSQGILADEPEKTVCQSSVEDLQMQVLSLTQALEDSNRENNHLRNIVIRFKEVLHEKFGLTQDEIEAMLVNNEAQQSQSKTPSVRNENIDERDALENM